MDGDDRIGTQDREGVHMSGRMGGTVVAVGARRPRIWVAVLVVAGLLAAVFANPAGAKVFNPETFTLDNGMQVVVVPNHRVPVVTQMIFYKVGAIDESPGQGGIAHLLEHLMFKGTSNHRPGEFSELVARNGGRENAFTSYDYTGYYQNVARDRLELVMALEADRMTNLVLTDAQVAPERQVVLEERHMRIDNDPAAVLDERADAVLYLNHPYRRPLIGWEHEIKTLSAADVLDFYKHWYTPNNAILVVAGDITAAELRPLAEKYYGAIPAVAPKPHLIPQEPPQKTARRITLHDERVRQPSWQRSYVAPSYINGATEHAYPLQLLARILGDGATSRLYRSLVVENPLAVDAGAWYDPSKRGPSRLSLYASPRPGVSMDQIEAAMTAAVDAVLRDGVTEDEIKRVKTGMLADAVYARDSLGTGARVLGEALAIGLTVDDVEAWPERISAVTKAQVDAAARAVLDGGHSVTALLLADGPEDVENGGEPAITGKQAAIR
jgi:zinc protease